MATVRKNFFMKLIWGVPSSFPLTAGIFWVVYAQIGCQKKKMTDPGPAQRLGERLPPYPAFKCTLMANSELNWNWLGTGWGRTNWAAQNTSKQSAPSWRARLSASTTTFVVHPQLHEITSKTLGKLSSAVNRRKPGHNEVHNTLKKFLNCNLGMGGCGAAAKMSTKGQGECSIKTVQTQMY